MQSKNIFTSSKLNKDVDERLLPNGEYPHAENIRVTDSDSFNGGIIENLLGNEKITSFNLTNAVTIGMYADSTNQKIYMFVTSDEKDLVVEYDDYNNVTTVLLESTKPNSVLNFNPNYLITGINKIYNENKRKDLLFWTDDYNPPRVINIERAKTYTVNGFTEKDMSVIKTPPLNAPVLTPFMSTDLSQNNLENKFPSFGYRYKYLDGEFSALSPFTYYMFNPNTFDIDYDSLENKAMINFLNSVRIDFLTGDYRVTDVELVYKESNSNTVYIIQSFNKKDEQWGDNQTVSFDFSNSKQYIALPEEELGRLYDNVPRKAKAQEIIGNRLVYGNYLENYNLVDDKGNDIVIDYNAGIQSNSLENLPVPITFSTNEPLMSTNLLEINLNNIVLRKGLVLTFNIRAAGSVYASGNFEASVEYILKQDYGDPLQLAADPDFEDFINITLTAIFTASYTSTIPSTATVNTINGFFMTYTSGDNIIRVRCPIVTYNVTGVPAPQTQLWQYVTTITNVTYRNIWTRASLKSNRSYEVGIIYQDEEGRSSTVLTCKKNTVNIPHSKATSQNKLRVAIENNPPAWATKYKFAIKENKLKYNEIYANIYYQDGQYVWVKLEGDNKNKVKEGDFLYIKCDADGFVPELHKVKVLEVSQKLPNFIGTNSTPELEGLYMKLRPPLGVKMRQDPSDTYDVELYAESKYGVAVQFMDAPNSSMTQGSSITLSIYNYKGGSSGGTYTFERTKFLSSDYLTFKDAFDTEFGSTAPFPTTTAPSSPIYTKLTVGGVMNGNGQHKSKLKARLTIRKNTGVLVFETVPNDNISEIFYESSESFDIINNLHIGNIQNQSTGTPAIVELGFNNCYSFANGIESNAYRSNSLANYVNMDLRPTGTSIEKYKENRRFADLTYSGTYNDSTNTNKLNNFNLSTLNYKDNIDKSFGSIQKLIARDTNLLVMQEDKISQVFYGKSILSNIDGTGNLGKIKDVLGEQTSYVGEYGVSQNPESVATFGNRVYFLDSKRGTPMRLSIDGLTEINDGMVNYFKDKLQESLHTKKIGGYDPYNDQYVLVDDKINIYNFETIDCGTNKYFKKMKYETQVIVELGEKTGTTNVNYNVTNGTVNITPIINDKPPVTEENLTGEGSFSLSKVLGDNPNLTLVVTPTSGEPDVVISADCIAGTPIKVVNIIINDGFDVGKTLKSRMRWIDYSDTYVSNYKNYELPFDSSYVTVFEELNGYEGVSFMPVTGSTIRMESVKSSYHDGKFFSTDRLRYLVSSTQYNQSDLNTILSLSTEMIYSTAVYPSGDTVVASEFVLLRPVGDEIVYLIWDYRGAVQAVNDEFEVPAFQARELNVLFNDVGVIPELKPVIINPPTNGTALVLPNKNISYNSTNDENDSFTYVLVSDDGSFTSNMATVGIISVDGYVTATYVSATSTLTSNCDGAGVELFDNLLYHVAYGDYPFIIVGTTMYTNMSLTTPFVGDGNWYHISGTLSIKINASGVVTEISNCTI